MEIPLPTGYKHELIVALVGSMIAVGLGECAVSFDATDGMFDAEADARFLGVNESIKGIEGLALGFLLRLNNG